jgi:hypothetical protein
MCAQWWTFAFRVAWNHRDMQLFHGAFYLLLYYIILIGNWTNRKVMPPVIPICSKLQPRSLWGLKLFKFCTSVWFPQSILRANPSNWVTIIFLSFLSFLPSSQLDFTYCQFASTNHSKITWQAKQQKVNWQKTRQNGHKSAKNIPVNSNPPQKTTYP